MRPKSKQFAVLSVISSALILSGFNFFTTQEEDTVKIKGLLNQVFTAINENKLENLTPLIDDKSFSVVTVDNQSFNKVEDLKAHVDSLTTGNQAKLKSIQIEADLNAAPQYMEHVAIWQGQTKDTYTMKNSKPLVIDTNWLAVIAKKDTEWKLSKLQFTTNFASNPLLDKAHKNTRDYAILALILGFLSGCVFMILLPKTRRKHTDAEVILVDE